MNRGTKIILVGFLLYLATFLGVYYFYTQKTATASEEIAALRNQLTRYELAANKDSSSQGPSKDGNDQGSVAILTHSIEKLEKELEREKELRKEAENQNAVTTVPTTGEGERPVLKDPQGRPMDFVISVRFVHCSIKLSVVKINEIFNPRRIIFLSYSKNDCLVLEGLAKNVKCIWEKEIIPTFTTDEFFKMVDEAKAKGRRDLDITRRRVGWVFLQIINIGVARYLPDLSEHYVVWDSDIVPLTKEMKFFDDEGRVLHYTQIKHVPLISKGYHRSYELLTGEYIIHPNGRIMKTHDNSQTWVSHQMVFTKEWVNEYLEAIEKYRGVERDQWPREVAKVVLHPDLAGGYSEVGFADYDHIASHAYRYHKEKMVPMIDSYKKFLRIEKISDYKDGTCCVPLKKLDEITKDGYHYLVNEIHKGDSQCRIPVNYYGLYHRSIKVSWKDDEDLIKATTT